MPASSASSSAAGTFRIVSATNTKTTAKPAVATLPVTYPRMRSRASRAVRCAVFAMPLRDVRAEPVVGRPAFDQQIDRQDQRQQSHDHGARHQTTGGDDIAGERCGVRSRDAIAIDNGPHCRRSAIQYRACGLPQMRAKRSAPGRRATSPQRERT